MGVGIESMWLQFSFLSCGFLKISELYCKILRLSKLNLMFLVQFSISRLLPLLSFLEGIGTLEYILKYVQMQ